MTARLCPASAAAAAIYDLVQTDLGAVLTSGLRVHRSRNDVDLDTVAS